MIRAAISSRQPRSMDSLMSRNALIERYRDLLPVSATTPIISLEEGGTPLLRAPRLESRLREVARGRFDLEVWLKYDGANPTGSFKDRGMTMAISKAVEEGTRGVICASTGNTSASAAAYAARAGIRSFVVIPQGKIAMGKLAQAVMHGARVIAVRGNFDQALDAVREVAGTGRLTLVNSVNPYRIEGQKTAAWEIVDRFGDAPDFHFIPVGNAGNITAHWKGYSQYLALGRARRCPRMMGFQAAGAAPIVDGHPIADPQTIATAIRIGNPASWKSAEEARDDSGGLIDKVTDEQILEAYGWIAALEGVFAEPASAASVAGLVLLARRGDIDLVGRAVCTLTGHGLKDPERAIAISERPIEVDATLAAVTKEIERS
jgi:threonine synthase